MFFIQTIYLIVVVLAGTALAKKAGKRDKPKPTADPVFVEIEPITVSVYTDVCFRLSL